MRLCQPNVKTWVSSCRSMSLGQTFDSLRRAGGPSVFSWKPTSGHHRALLTCEGVVQTWWKVYSHRVCYQPVASPAVMCVSVVFGMFVCLGSELTRWVSVSRTARGLGPSATSRPSRPPSPCSSCCHCDKDPPHYPHAQLLPPSDSLPLPH